MICRLRLILFVSIYVLSFAVAKAEGEAGSKIDSLMSLLNNDSEDSNKVKHLSELCLYYNASNKIDKALELGNQAVALAEKINNPKGEAEADNALGNVYFTKKDYGNALLFFEKALKICERGGKDTKSRVATIFDNIGLTYEAEGDFDRAQEYYQDAMKVAQEIGDKQLQAYTMGNIGNFYTMQGDDSKALEYYTKAIKMKEELGDKKGVARGSSNIALQYKDQGDYPKALEFYNNAMKMAVEIGDKQLEANIASNIGAVYREEDDYNKALEYDFKALKLAEELKYAQLQASTASSIGLIYWRRSNYSKALQYYNQALKLAEESGDKSTAAIITDNIGIVCENQGNFPDALDYEFKALKISKDIGDKAGAAINTESIGEIYIKQKKYKEAEKYILQALYLSDTMHLLQANLESNFNLSELFSQTGQWQKAYDAYKQYVSAKDSLESKDKSKELGKLEAKAEYDKELALQKAEQDKRAAVEVIESKRRDVVMVLIGAIALAVAVMALIIFRSLRTTRQQKHLIEQQKAEVENQKVLVEEKNKDMLDSIAYAQRLQEAILPPISTIKKHLPQSFILYKPKEIIAGDFYWIAQAPLKPSEGGASKLLEMPPLGGGGGHPFFIAACDCTGHGVPGAMLSVVCSNALNRTVKEFEITDPGKILDKVGELVHETFTRSDSSGQTGTDVQDGMDISLCAISHEANDNVKIQWSGANSTMLIVPANKDASIEEMVAGNNSIGMHDGVQSFTTIEKKLNKGDIVYLFTDGYANQLSKNGEGLKKFKEKIAQVCDLGMEEQKKKLEQILQEHNIGSGQNDDILVIGVRV